MFSSLVFDCAYSMVNNYSLDVSIRWPNKGLTDVNDNIYLNREL